MNKEIKEIFSKYWWIILVGLFIQSVLFSIFSSESSINTSTEASKNISSNKIIKQENNYFQSEEIIQETSDNLPEQSENSVQNYTDSSNQNSYSSISQNKQEDTLIDKYEPSNNENSNIVWVGKTGTKYHNKNCRTLKGNGHQISLSEAISQGKEPCKVCH